MPLILGFFFFALGAIVGSFLNVVILRYHTGRSVRGRSKCFSCGATLRSVDLVPIVSFLALRGRCARCGSRISFQYPLVEFLTGLLFAGVFSLYGAPLVSYAEGGFAGPFSAAAAAPLLYYFLMWSILVVIGVYDLKHKIIPDGFVWSFAALALLRPFLAFAGFPARPLLEFLAGPFLAAPLVFLWVVSRGRWIGLGDGKLALGIGWFLGFFLGTSAIVLGFWIGAAVGVLLILFGRFPALCDFVGLSGAAKQLTMKSEIPFAPFLIIGTGIAFFFRIDVLGLAGLFMF